MMDFTAEGYSAISEKELKKIEIKVRKHYKKYYGITSFESFQERLERLLAYEDANALASIHSHFRIKTHDHYNHYIHLLTDYRNFKKLKSYRDVLRLKELLMLRFSEQHYRLFDQLFLRKSKTIHELSDDEIATATEAAIYLDAIGKTTGLSSAKYRTIKLFSNKTFFSKEKLQAMDALRALLLLRGGIFLGYMNEEEALEHIDTLNTVLYTAFDSLTDLVDMYLEYRTLLFGKDMPSKQEFLIRTIKEMQTLGLFDDELFITAKQEISSESIEIPIPKRHPAYMFLAIYD